MEAVTEKLIYLIRNVPKMIKGFNEAELSERIVIRLLLYKPWLKITWTI